VKRPWDHKWKFEFLLRQHLLSIDYNEFGLVVLEIIGNCEDHTVIFRLPIRVSDEKRLVWKVSRSAPLCSVLFVAGIIFFDIESVVLIKLLMLK
jgi:hypothetical protein